ncbi:MAG: LLM class flavin-dependent oxidoreductase [Chloroflexi bacterium]|nr:LLM class flavin-dependent oxidoreductase [Chloroflexota bacterium]
MEFGIFDQLPCADYQTPANRYADIISQAQYADELGYDTVWLAEVHFNPRFSVLPAPLLLGSAIAQSTSRVKIATAVNLLPLHHPVRMAEEFATLDIISEGRAILGTGRGAMLQQYSGYGIQVDEGRDRFLEGLDLVLKAWTSDELHYDGKYYQVSGVRVVPKPYQKPYPPVYIASNSVDTFPMVGELGQNILIAPIVVTLDGATSGLKEYRKRLVENGHNPSEKKVNINVLVHASRDENGSANREFEASVRNYLSILEGNRSRVITGRTRDLSYEHVSTELSAMGSPDRIIDKLEEIKELLGADEFMCWFAAGGLMPNEDVKASMRLFAEEVIPHFK